MAADLALSETAFDAKYGPIRRVLDAAYRRRHRTRAADGIFARLEDLTLGSRVRRPLAAPAFVTGSYRSGTTALERILARHPAFGTFDHLGYSFPRSPLISHALRRVLGGGEAPFAAPDQPNLELSSHTPAELEPIWLASAGHLWSDAPSHVLGAEHEDPRFERVFLVTVQKILLRQGRPRFLNKNPLHTLRVGYLARLFPDARFVHVVRHPHRVVRSQLDLERMWARVLSPAGPARDWAMAFVDAFMPPGRRFPRTRRWERIEAVRGQDPALAVAMSIVDFEEAFETAVAAGGLEQRVLRVRYEELVAEPGRTLRRIFRHLGLEDDTAEGIAADAARRFVDRGLPSGTSALPRFAEEVEAELAELARASRLP